MSRTVILEKDRFGNPSVVSVSVRTTFFTRKTVLVDARQPFDKDAVAILSRPYFGTHLWNLQGVPYCLPFSGIEDFKFLLFRVRRHRS
jgi:hypothetical protein